jgi:hypothetical protein
VFARKLRVEIEEQGALRPVPLDWMDHFFMRSFTGLSAMDETLPVADGRLEAGLRVEPSEITAEFGKWLHGRKMIPPEAILRVSAAILSAVILIR